MESISYKPINILIFLKHGLHVLAIKRDNRKYISEGRIIFLRYFEGQGYTQHPKWERHTFGVLLFFKTPIISSAKLQFTTHKASGYIAMIFGIRVLMIIHHCRSQINQTKKMSKFMVKGRRFHICNCNE